jgi:mutator protein MutT
MAYLFAMHLVVAAALIRHHQVLLCHRSPQRAAYPNVWDFAGGHVEPGESPHSALSRELREELGVELDVQGLPEAPTLHVRLADLDLSIWVVSEWTGEPTNLAPEEHDSIGWFDKATALGLPLAHPSCRELIEQHLRPEKRQPVSDPREA